MSGSGSESHEHVTNYTQTEKARSNRAYQPSLDASLRFPEDAPLAMNGDLHSTLADRVRERQTEGPKGRAKRELRRHLSKLDAKEDNLSEDALARARRKKVLRHHLGDLRAVGAFKVTTIDKLKDRQANGERVFGDLAKNERRKKDYLRRKAARSKGNKRVHKSLDNNPTSSDEEEFKSRRDSDSAQEESSDFVSASSDHSSDNDIAEDEVDNKSLDQTMAGGGITKAVTLQVDPVDLLSRKERRKIPRKGETEQEYMRFRSNYRNTAAEDGVQFIESKTTGEFIRVYPEKKRTMELAKQEAAKTYDYESDVDNLVYGANSVQKLLSVVYLITAGALVGAAFVVSTFVDGTTSQDTFLGWYSVHAQNIHVLFFMLTTFCLSYSIWDWLLCFPRASRLARLEVTLIVLFFGMGYFATLGAAPIDDNIYLRYSADRTWYTDNTALKAYQTTLDDWYNIQGLRLWTAIFAYILVCHKFYETHMHGARFVDDFNFEDLFHIQEEAASQRSFDDLETGQTTGSPPRTRQGNANTRRGSMDRVSPV